MLDRFVDSLARIGWHGAAGALLIITFCFLVAYVVVVTPESSVANEIVGAFIILLGAGGVKGLDSIKNKRAR